MKPTMLNRRLLIAGGLPFIVTACGASSEPGQYALASRPGAVLPRGPKIVLLRDIGLAGYLDRKEIVRTTDGYRLAVQANDWWSESLGPMIGRTLVVELAQRLPASSVYAESGAISVDPNATVSVNIQSLEVDRSGAVVLLAQAAIDFNRPKRTGARTFTISKPCPTQDVAGQVAATSDALGELADGLAQMLQA